LLRYGPRGHEKPGLIDRKGQIRDLSGTVGDITGESPVAGLLDRLRRLDPGDIAAGLGLAADRTVRRIGVKNRRDRAQLPAACRGGRRADPEGADLLYEGDLLDLRPQ
jgi:hypothetical protein